MLHALLLALTLGSAPRAAIAADSARPDGEVQEIVLRHADDVRKCYQSEGLRRDPAMRVMLELELTILPTGRVDSAAVSTPDVKGPGVAEVAACISTAARNWRFERGPYAADTFVFPLRLLPEEPQRVARTSATD